MAEEEVIQQQGEAPAMSESDQAAVNRYKESLVTSEERNQNTEMPDGYNADGTVKEELIGGKFKSQDDLLTAYKELEQKLGKPPAEPEPKPDEAKPVDENIEAPDGTAFNPSVYEKEFATEGKLSDASYEDLSKKGFTKDMVDQYIAGKQHYAQSVQSRIYEVSGGEQAYTEMVTWAADNMPPEVIAEYNESLLSLDESRVTRNIEYMQFKMAESQPAETRRLEGDGVPGGIQPFADKNEWQRAQGNRLYGKDKKYTNMVDNRYLMARKKGVL